MDDLEIGKTIKQHRTELGWSQEALAEKAYVSRQTVSNWETEKSYPDVHSLLILSDLFGVSLDELIKGDVAVMKEQVKSRFHLHQDVWAVPCSTHTLKDTDIQER